LPGLRADHGGRSKPNVGSVAGRSQLVLMFPQGTSSISLGRVSHLKATACRKPGPRSETGLHSIGRLLAAERRTGGPLRIRRRPQSENADTSEQVLVHAARHLRFDRLGHVSSDLSRERAHLLRLGRQRADLLAPIRCRPASGDLGSSKNLDFQAPWHHFQLVRLYGSGAEALARRYPRRSQSAKRCEATLALPGQGHFSCRPLCRVRPEEFDQMDSMRNYQFEEEYALKVSQRLCARVGSSLFSMEPDQQ
jgi:hypothetical protein